MDGRILVIEDNATASMALEAILKKDGFEVVTAQDGENGLARLDQYRFDVILLDLMLPTLDGAEVLRSIRRISDVPVIIVSAKDTDIEKAAGLGLGADDFMTKPVSAIELTARIRAVLRRSTRTPSPRWVRIGDLLIGLESYQVFRNGTPIALTLKEFMILRLLVTQPKKVYSKRELYRIVWEDQNWFDDNSVNVHIRRLRTKVEADPAHPRIVETVWGVGYKFDGTYEEAQAPEEASR